MKNMIIKKQIDFSSNLSNYISKELIDLCRLLLEKNPDKRITLLKIKDSLWYSKKSKSQSKEDNKKYIQKLIDNYHHSVSNKIKLQENSQDTSKINDVNVILSYFIRIRILLLVRNQRKIKS